MTKQEIDDYAKWLAVTFVVRDGIDARFLAEEHAQPGTVIPELAVLIERYAEEG